MKPGCSSDAATDCATEHTETQDAAEPLSLQTPRANGAASGIISDRAILRGVAREFARTLPYWRCYADLRLRHRHRPVIMEQHTRLVCRLPCERFAGVDVVWAETEVHLRVSTAQQRENRASTTKRAVQPAQRKARLAQAWRATPHVDSVCTLGTLHFVHHGAHRRGSVGAERSFHVQSVVLKEEPARLQCVADTMIGFAFVLYSSLALLRVAAMSGSVGKAPRHGSWLRARLQRAAVSDLPHDGRVGVLGSLEDFVCAATDDAVRAERQALRALCPSATSRVLILGMGGNSMMVALRHLLGPCATLVVVEVEEAVVRACQVAGTWDEHAQHTTLHRASAETWLASCGDPAATASFDLIFLDLFEPVQGCMQNELSIVEACRRVLRVGGLLVINDHKLPSEAGLRPFSACFGHGQVHAVNVHGWAESVVVCVKAAAQQGDVADAPTFAAACHKGVVKVALELYNTILPGWLPPASWLRSSRLTRSCGCRIWLS